MNMSDYEDAKGQAHDYNDFATAIHAVREYTGMGVKECRKAVVACEGDPLMACGYLHYAGCAVNLNGQDVEAWTLRSAKDYAKLLMLDEWGRICQAPAPSLKPLGAGMR